MDAVAGEKYRDEHANYDNLAVAARNVAFDEEYMLCPEHGTAAMSVVRASCLSATNQFQATHTTGLSKEEVERAKRPGS
mgnify:CR=1 FL=1